MKKLLLLLLVIGIRAGFGQCSPPVVSGSDTAICAGDSVLLCVPDTFSAYHWNTEDTTACIYAKNAGNYRVTVTDKNNCTAVSETRRISVFPEPAMCPIIAQGDTLTCFGVVSCQWFINDSLIPGATNFTYVVTRPGYYSVEYINQNGCKRKCGLDRLTYSIYDLDNYQASIFPNPANGLLNISVNNFVPHGITIYDTDSRIVTERKFTPQLDISNLTNGVYIVEVRNAKVSTRVRLVKM